MKLRYFVVDRRGILRRAPRAVVKGLWEGRRAGALACAAKTEVRLVSVVCGDDLLPRKIFLLRLPLTEGRFTRLDYLVLQAFTRADCVTPGELLRHHTEGWPPNFFRQLAVALDVPLSGLHVPMGVGGPLFVAAARSVTPRQALRYLR